MLTLRSAAFAALEQHCREGFPDERCGLLIGSWDRDQGHRVALEAHPTGNLNTERAHDRYEIDPKDHLRIENEARDRGLEIVGVYHSHPDHPSQPSETDRARAEQTWDRFESWSYLIVEVAAGEPASWRSWVLSEREFQQEDLHVEPET